MSWSGNSRNLRSQGDTRNIQILALKEVEVLTERQMALFDYLNALYTEGTLKDLENLSDKEFLSILINAINRDVTIMLEEIERTEQTRLI